MNKWFCTGIVAKEPEIRTATNSKSYCTFSIATKTGFGDKATALFMNCIAWNNTAENISKYCHKGDTIGIIGTLEANNYSDNNGNKHYGVTVRILEFEYLHSPKSKQQNSGLSDNQGQFIGLGGADQLGDDLPF